MATTEYLRTGEAARLLGVSAETVRRWTKEGRIRHIRMPSGRHVYRREDVEAILHPVEPNEGVA